MSTAGLELSALPFVDGHLHAPLLEFPADLDAYRWQWYEGQREDASLAADLTAYRWAIHELAAQLRCPDDEASVVAAIAGRDVRAWAREALAEAGVAGLVVDTGYPPPELVLAPGELAEAGGVPVATLLRIERTAGDLAVAHRSFDGFLEAFDAEVEGARAAGHAGLKSIVAYRSGLAVGPSSLDDARNAFERERARGQGAARLAEKPLLDFLLVRSLAAARRQELPLQLHTGYGDPDIDLRLANPLELRWLLESGEARGVPIVLLHAAYPFVREGAWLAAVYPNVYLDVATCIPPLGFAALVEAWQAALAVAPLSRLQASSDAAGLVEHIGLGAHRARASLGRALGELCRARTLSVAEAEEAAALILAGTARRLYLGG